MRNFEEIRREIVSLAREIDDIKDPRMGKLEKDFLELIELLMFSLMRDRDNFFGNVLIQLNRQIRYDLKAPAGVAFKGTYFDLYLNPFLMAFVWKFDAKQKKMVIERERTLNEYKAILIHEAYHVLNEHIKRTSKIANVYPFILINLGTDAAINQYIPDMPREAVFPDNLSLWGYQGPPLERERESEYYINRLLDEYKKNPKFKQFIDDISAAEGEWSSGGESGSGGGINKEDTVSHSHDSWAESDKGGGEYENMRDVVAGIANTAASRARGTIPGRVQELIRKLNEKPILQWHEILRQFVGTVPVPYKKTIMRRDRRQPERYDLRGRLADRQAVIYVAIDTSGSMSEEAIAYCMNEIFEIVRLTKHKVTIIECDTAIGKVYEAKRASDVQTKVTGRGGTSFTPVFEYIKEKGDRRAILVYFTDGFGEHELGVKPAHYRTLWVLTGETGHLSLREPHGDVRELRLDRKWKERAR